MRLDPEKAKELLAKVVKDMRSNRVWLLAIVLLVAIVAVPIALSKTSSATPVASLPQATPPPAPGNAIAALNVQSSPSQSRLHGHGRDPFAQHGSTKSSAATTATTTTPGSGSTTTTGGSSTGAAGSSTPSSSAAPPTSTNVSPPTITSNKKPTPAPSGLTANQSYRVVLAITNSAGGLDTIDPLERLTVLPSARQPLLVELGVLKGGSRVLFAVQPGTVVGGPGTCTPGPIDCEILSLGQDQTEALGVQSPTGPVGVALFAVTAVTAQAYSSAAAADKARRTESPAGRRLLDASTLNALSLFQYEPSVGAVVDRRNLTAGDR
jgi:hypothetical protein